MLIAAAVNIDSCHISRRIDRGGGGSLLRPRPRRGDIDGGEAGLRQCAGRNQADRSCHNNSSHQFEPKI